MGCHCGPLPLDSQAGPQGGLDDAGLQSQCLSVHCASRRQATGYRQHMLLREHAGPARAGVPGTARLVHRAGTDAQSSHLCLLGCIQACICLGRMCTQQVAKLSAVCCNEWECLSFVPILLPLWAPCVPTEMGPCGWTTCWACLTVCCVSHGVAKQRCAEVVGFRLGSCGDCATGLPDLMMCMLAEFRTM